MPSTSSRLFISNSTSFPKTLEGFDQIVPLGGGTMSTFKITHPSYGSLVLKVGVHADAMKLEIVCKELYRVMGILTPESEVYDTLPEELAKRIGVKSHRGTFLLSQHIQATPREGASASIIETAAQSFVAHALLGNIDIAKEDQFIIDQEGLVFLVDAGSNFIFRALGKEREQVADQLTELDSLRNSQINSAGHVWFEKLSQTHMQEQATAIIRQLPQLEQLIWDLSLRLQIPEALREKLIEDFSTRLMVLAKQCNVNLEDNSANKRRLATPNQKWRSITNFMIHQKYLCADIREVVALKEVWQNRKLPSTQVVRQHQPSGRLAQSEIHLKSVLGNGYVEGCMETNVRSMVESHFTKTVAKIRKESLIQELVEMIAREQQQAEEYVFFYHAANDVIAFAYTVYTQLHQSLMARELYTVFRAQGHYFKPFANMSEFMAHYRGINQGSLDNYSQGFNDCALSTNIFLFGNHQHDSSCSFLYLLNNYVNRGSELINILKDLFRKFRIPKEMIDQLLFLHSQSEKKNGGVLYQIAVPRAEVAQWAYPSRGGGVLNPHPSSTSLDLGLIIDAMRQSVDANANVNQDYVQNLQARLLVPPNRNFMTHQIRAENSSVADNNPSQQQLAQVIDEITSCVLRNLSEGNKEHLNPDLALFKILPSLLTANQLNIKCNSIETAEIDLVKAVSSSNDASVVELVTTWPALLTRPVVDPEQTNFFRDYTSGENSSLTLINFMLQSSNLSSETFVHCFGSEWWNTHIIKNSTELENALKKIPNQYRFSFVTKHHQRICTQHDLAKIVKLLPEDRRLELVQSKIDKIESTFGTSLVLEKIPSADRFNWFQTLPDSISNIPDMAYLLRAFTDAEKLQIIKAKAHLLTNGSQLADILDHVDASERYAIACSYKMHIRDTNELARIMQQLAPDVRKPFALLNREITAKAKNLSSIVILLPQNERHFFVLSMDLKLSADVILELIDMVLPEERSYYIPLLQQTVNTASHVRALLAHLPPVKWLETIEQKIEKVDRWFDGFATELFDKYTPKQCPANLALAFKKGEKNRLFDTFRQFIRSITHLDVCVYLKAFELDLVNIDQVVAILKQTPEDQQLKFIRQYDAIVLSNLSNTSRVLEVLHTSHRLTYANTFYSSVPADKRRADILVFIPAGERMDYLAAHPGWFTWTSPITDKEFLIIMNLLPKTMQSEVAEKQSLIINSHRLEWALSNTALDHRLAYFEKYTHLIRNGQALGKILTLLPSQCIAEIARKTWAELAEKTNLDLVVQALPTAERSAFIEEHKAFITEVNDFAAIALLLENQELQNFLNQHLHLLKSGPLVVNIARQLPEAGQRPFLETYLPPVNTDESLVLALTHLIPVSERLAYAMSHAVDSYSPTALASLLALLENDQERERFVVSMKNSNKSTTHIAAAAICFTEPNRYPFVDKYQYLIRSGMDLADFLPFVPSSVRLDFLTSYLDCITTNKQLRAVVAVDPIVLGLLYPLRLSALVSNTKDLNFILDQVPSTSLYQYVRLFWPLIKTYSDLLPIIAKLNEHERLFIITKATNMVQTPAQIAGITALLDRDLRKVYLQTQSHKIIDLNDLIELIKETDRALLSLGLDLSEYYQDKVRTSSDFYSVYQSFSDITYRQYYLKYALTSLKPELYQSTFTHYLTTGNSLSGILNKFPCSNRYTRACELESYVRSCAELVLVLDCLSMETRFDFAVLKASLITNSKDLKKILNILPQDKQDSFVKLHVAHLATEESEESENPSETLQKGLPSHTQSRSAIAKSKVESPETEEEFIELLKDIRDDKECLEFLEQYKHFITTDAILGKVLDRLPESQRFRIARKYYLTFTNKSEISATYARIPLLQRHAYWSLARPNLALEDSINLLKYRCYAGNYDYPSHFNLFEEKDRIRLAEACYAHEYNLVSIVACLPIQDRSDYLQHRVQHITKELQVSGLCPLLPAYLRYNFVQQFKSLIKDTKLLIPIFGSLTTDECAEFVKHFYQYSISEDTLLVILSSLPASQRLHLAVINYKVVEQPKQLLAILNMLPVTDRAKYLRLMLASIRQSSLLETMFATLVEDDQIELRQLVVSNPIEPSNPLIPLDPTHTTTNLEETTCEIVRELIKPSILAIEEIPAENRLEFAFSLLDEINNTTELSFVLQALAPVERSALDYVPQCDFFGEVCIPVIMRELTGFYREQFALQFGHQIKSCDVLLQVIVFLPKEKRLSIIVQLQPYLVYMYWEKLLPHLTDTDKNNLVQKNHHRVDSAEKLIHMLALLPLNYRYNFLKLREEVIQTVEQLVCVVSLLPNDERYMFVFHHYQLFQSEKQLTAIAAVLSEGEIKVFSALWEENHLANECVQPALKKARIKESDDAVSVAQLQNQGMFSSVDACGGNHAPSIPMVKPG